MIISSLPRFLENGQSEIELGIKGDKAETLRAFDMLKTTLQERGLKISML